MSMVLKSDAFVDGAHIPVRYTCEGENISPPLTWECLPEGTASLVLVVDDPDAPDPAAPRMVWDHWILYNLPPEAMLAEGMTSDLLPSGPGKGSTVGAGSAMVALVPRSAVTAISIVFTRSISACRANWGTRPRTSSYWQWKTTSSLAPSWSASTRSVKTLNRVLEGHARVSGR